MFKGEADRNDWHDRGCAAARSRAPREVFHPGEHRHVAALFATPEERYNVLAPFISEGLERVEKAIHLIDPPDRDRHLRQLEEHGVPALHDTPFYTG